MDAKEALERMTAKLAERWESWKVDVPEGEHGRFVVERFAVEDVWACSLADINEGRATPPGTYTRLRERDKEWGWMTDTVAEADDHEEFCKKATGRILINGLGLGMCIKQLLAKESVLSIDVVEREPDVVALVGPTYTQDPRVTIYCEDAYEIHWNAGQGWDYAWHDIWAEMSAENVRSMRWLFQKYEGRAKWQGFWSMDYLEEFQPYAVVERFAAELAKANAKR